MRSLSQRLITLWDSICSENEKQVLTNFQNPNILRLTVLVLAVIISGCATIDLPKGTSKGYSTFCFVHTNRSSVPFFAESSVPVNRMVQDAISEEFESQGLTIDDDNASTAMIDSYFGHGRSAGDIVELAHKNGVLKATTPDNFEAGAIVIDLIDAKTDELVYRHFAKRDLIKNISDEKRRQRVTDAVNEALAPFFR